MKTLNHYLSILLFIAFAVMSIPAQAQPDIHNLTPEQQRNFENKLRQRGVVVEYKKLTAEERERYYRFIRQEEVKEQQTRQGQPQRQQHGQVQNENAINRYNTILTPLTDFGNKRYQGVKGGLYPNGENVRPKAHNEAGLAIAKSIKPLDRNGKVDEKNGKIVWMSVGMSNTTQSSQRFLELMSRYPNKNPVLELVDGAFGGQEINRTKDADAPYWENIVSQRLEPRGLTPEQVQIVWFKQAEARPSDTTFLTYTKELKEKYLTAIYIVKKKFPNVKIVYLSSRIYGGYAKSTLNPEPFAWYTGWANKFLIEDQINGDPRLAYTGKNAKAPWLSWGPYFWANGTTPNAQGFSWVESDMAEDGTHPGTTARQKVAEGLIKFFETDETAVPWFLRK